MEREWKERREAILKDIGALSQKILGTISLNGTKIRLLKGGYVNVVFLAEKGNTKRVVKISVDESIQDEVYWYNEANKAGLSVPAVVAYDLSKKEVPYKYMILDYIDGKPPDWKSKEILYKAGLFAGKQLRMLHGITVGGFGSIEPDGKWTNKTWLEALKDQRRFNVKDETALKILKQAQIDQIDNFTIFNKELDINDPRLLHGDLYEDNVLYSKKTGKFFVIDPSYVIGGDPMYDVSYAMVERSEGFDKGFKDGYNVNDLDEAEKYRLEALAIFQIFKELTEYIENNDSKQKINKLHNLLLERLSNM